MFKKIGCESGQSLKKQMLLQNKPYLGMSDNIPDNTVKVLFHTLEPGDRYQCTPNGKIRTVFRKERGLMIVRRDDDWLVTCLEGGFSWDREVIKV